MQKPQKISKLFKSWTKMSIFFRKGVCSRKGIRNSLPMLSNLHENQFSIKLSVIS